MFGTLRAVRHPQCAGRYSRQRHDLLGGANSDRQVFGEPLIEGEAKPPENSVHDDLGDGIELF